MKIRNLLSIIVFFIGYGISSAQSLDPTLAGLIAIYMEKAESTLSAQEKMMELETMGHVWIQEEVDGTYKLHKEFNEYLDSFRGIVIFAAQIYGFYHEIDKMIDNMEGLSKQIGDSPGNAVAVALSANRNHIYREIILKSVEIVNDIRTLTLSGTKMTEKERVEILLNIRPKLKEMNIKLQRLTRAVKYTSLTDIWNELNDNEPEKANIGSISKTAMQRWKEFGKKVRP